MVMNGLNGINYVSSYVTTNNGVASNTCIKHDKVVYVASLQTQQKVQSRPYHDVCKTIK